jgi:hypothetical protein
LAIVPKLLLAVELAKTVDPGGELVIVEGPS